VTAAIRHRENPMPLPRRLRALTPLLALAAACGAGEAAADQQYQSELAALRKLIETRDLELFELNCEALAFDRITLQRPTGSAEVYHYLVFRIRNQATDSTQALALKAKGYNEVLKAITEQFQQAKVEQEGGVRLKVDGVADAKDAVILERQESKPKARSVRLAVTAWDDRGTRMQLLDDPVGSGTQNTWSFADVGAINRPSIYRDAHDAIEARVRRRLFSLDEIRATRMEPFDGVKRVEADDLQDAKYDTKGWFVGELYGVAIFDRFDDRGKKIHIELHGLSNKLRVRGPAGQPGKVDNYLEARYQRRAYVLDYDWPGDEFYRHEDAFVPVRAGYAWVDAFVRQEHRASIAFAKYFLDNIVGAEGQRRAEVEAQWWDYYKDMRSGRQGGKYAEQLPDLEAASKDRSAGVKELDRPEAK
jgi:hypothetical protein